MPSAISKWEFSSFVMQSTIVIFATVALVCLDSWPLLRKESIKVHTEALVTALVDFQKPQHSFAITIQITALDLFHQVQSARRLSIGEDIYPQPTQEVLDGVMLLDLPTSGLIPVTFTLVGIVRYGRQS